ncbi:MAG: hypothetical protein Q8K92_15505 [Leadbetterella sp.]|nr:hypothetical protein [Leadbetterella sp.]
MKKTILILFTLTQSYAYAQLSTEQFKLDSTELARKKTLTSLTNDIKNLVLANEANTSKAKLDEIANNLKAFGDKQITPLSGDVTISKGEFSTPETKAMVDDALNEAIATFETNLKKSISDKNVLVYGEPHFKGINQYKIIKAELDKLAKNYQKLSIKINNPGPAAALGSIALGFSVVRAVADLSTIFNTESKIIVNNELVSESYIISKIVKKLGNKNFFYPSIFPIKPIIDSELLKMLKVIEDNKNQVNIDIENFKDTKPDEEGNTINKLNEKINKKNIDLANLTLDLFKAKKANMDTVNIKKSIDLVKTDIKGDELKLKQLSKKLNEYIEIFKNINNENDSINERLNFIVDKENNRNALESLLVVEQIFNLINDDAVTLKVSASGIGSTIIKKNKWKTKVNSIGSIQIEYLLFDKLGKIIDSDAFNKFGEKSTYNNLR